MILAKMIVNAGEDYAKKLAQFGKDSPEITKKVVMAGANPIADEIRNNLEANINDPAYVGLGDGGVMGTKTTVPSGDLLKSLGIAPPCVDSKGNTNTKIGFEGYDRKGVPNALKGRAMESGTSKLKKRPFVRPSVNRTKQKAIDEMGKKLDDEMKIYAL